MNINDFTIRLERSEDYREVENLVRESLLPSTVSAVSLMPVSLAFAIMICRRVRMTRSFCAGN